MNSSSSLEIVGESSFYDGLKNRKWICVGDGEVSAPFEVFVKEPVLIRYYGNRVPYTINSPSKIYPAFANDIGFKTEFNFVQFIHYFETWTRNPEVNFEYFKFSSIKQLITLN